MFYYLFLRERQRQSVSGGEAEREGDTGSISGSKLSAQSPMRGSNCEPGASVRLICKVTSSEKHGAGGVMLWRNIAAHSSKIVITAGMKWKDFYLDSFHPPPFLLPPCLLRGSQQWDIFQLPSWTHSLAPHSTIGSCGSSWVLRHGPRCGGR